MIAILLGTLLPAGCGGGLSVPSTVPVKGVVTYLGNPTSGIRIKFHNRDGSHEEGYIPTGETGADGGFVMSTGAPQNGAPPGTYAVTFELPIIDPEQSVETEIDGFNGMYSDPETSMFLVTIGDRQPDPLVFVLDLVAGE